MYKFFEHLKDCYYEIKAIFFKSRLNFDLSFWKYLFLRGMTVARSSWNCQKLKKLKVDLGKVEFVRSWKSEKLKIAWVENAKVEKFQSWKCKCWICEKLKLQKLKRQGWKCKVENAKLNHHVAYFTTYKVYIFFKEYTNWIWYTHYLRRKVVIRTRHQIVPATASIIKI